MSAEVLALPRKEGMFVLDTDASNVAVGGVLSQRQNGTLRPIAFASKRLIAAQRKYCTTRKELLAVVTFTRQFRHYVLGRRFLIRTDHSSLAWLMRFKDIEGQLARWLEELAQYDMQIIHRKGKEHGNADALSRLPDSLYYCDCYKAGAEVDSLPCGGCPYCTRAHTQWGRFEEDVDDVVPLAVASPVFPRINVCAKEGDSNWADVILPEQQGEEQELDPDLRVLRSWMKEGKEPQKETIAAQSPDVKGLWTNRPLLKWKDGVLWYL